STAPAPVLCPIAATANSRRRLRGNALAWWESVCIPALRRWRGSGDARSRREIPDRAVADRTRRGFPPAASLAGLRPVARAGFVDPPDSDRDSSIRVARQPVVLS